MTSAYLDSDSDSDLGVLSDSDTELPPCPIRSPAKLPRPAEGSFSEIRHPQHTTKPAPEQTQRNAEPSTPTKMTTAPLKVLATPPSSSGSLSQLGLSPSPHKLAERHEKALQHQHRLIKKVERLAADMKTKNEMTSKLEEYRAAGGIRGLSRDCLHSTSSEGDGEEAADTAHSSKQSASYIESNKFPFPLFAPGYAVFSHAPKLIVELYPPGYHEVEEGPFKNLEINMMQQQSPEFLSQLIHQRWYLLCYRLKPCPRHIWEWLFQIMCLSCDEQLAQRAYMNLKVLVEWSTDKQQVYVPTLSTIMDVLVSLGGDKDVLEGRGLGRGHQSPAAKPSAAEASDDIFQAPLPVSNLLNLLRYLAEVVTFASPSLSPDDFCRLILTCATVSLDSALTRHPRLNIAITHCISSLVRTFPREAWSTICLPMAAQLVQRAVHHHDYLHLAQLLVPTTPSVAQLHKSVSRLALWKTVFPGVTMPELSDWEFAWKIVQHYYETPASAFEYYPLYTKIYLLGQLLHRCPPEWPSLEKKRHFKSMLSKLASVKIIDSADRPERGPVKDMLISLALEMTTQRSRDAQQTDLFSVMGR